jgi:hypothetical protein
MEVDEPFTEFIDYVKDQELSEEALKMNGNVKYSQARELNRRRLDLGL